MVSIAEEEALMDDVVFLQLAYGKALLDAAAGLLDLFFPERGIELMYSRGCNVFSLKLKIMDFHKKFLLNNHLDSIIFAE